MTDPPSILFLVRKGSTVMLIRAKDGLWTLPGAKTWDGMDESVEVLAREALTPYFFSLEIGKARLLVSPSEPIVIDDERRRCAIFEIPIKGKCLESAVRNTLFAHKDTLVPYVITPDVRGVLSLTEIQNCLP